MNDGAAVLLFGYTSQIPPPRRVLGFRSGKRAGYALKLHANTRHSAERASCRRLQLPLLLQMDTRTDGRPQVRRPGSALSWAVRGQRRGLGSQTLRGLDESAAPRLFLAPFRTRQVQERAHWSNRGSQNVSEPPSRDEQSGYGVVTMFEC